MFTQDNSQSIRHLGEVRLIAKIREWLGETAPPPPKGMGDDCAVVAPPNSPHQILTTDSLTYGQHFDDQVSAKDAGSKLVKRNLSDIAAMGGYPDHALLTLLCGADLRIDWLAEFVAGIADVCKRYGVGLVGGDVSALPQGQFISAMSLTGHMALAPLLRSGASVGDAIYVTGSLGGSILEKHYRFEPRLHEGQWLAQSGQCTALMDLTDGLAKDLGALLPVHCAAHLDMARIPLSPAAHRHAATSGRTPMEHAFCDGEDYELLFTVEAVSDLDQFEASWMKRFPATPLIRIGQIQPRKGDAPYLDANTQQALPWIQGFEHLAEQ